MSTKPRILAVDRNRRNPELLAELLCKEGYATLTGATVEEFEQALVAHADVALALTPDRSAKLVPQACEWIESPNKLLLPEKIGKLLPLPSVRSRHSAGLSAVTVSVLVMIALSLKTGTRFGFQFVAECQSPLMLFVQTMSRVWKWANSVLLFVITRVMELLRVTTSPVHA